MPDDIDGMADTIREARDELMEIEPLEEVVHAARV